MIFWMKAEFFFSPNNRPNLENCLLSSRYFFSSKFSLSSNCGVDEDEELDGIAVSVVVDVVGDKDEVDSDGCCDVIFSSILFSVIFYSSYAEYKNYHKRCRDADHWQ